MAAIKGECDSDRSSIYYLALLKRSNHDSLPVLLSHPAASQSSATDVRVLPPLLARNACARTVFHSSVNGSGKAICSSSVNLCTCQCLTSLASP